MIVNQGLLLKSVLLISFSVIHSDPRVMRQVRLLESEYDVTVAGYGQKPDANINFLAIDKAPARLPQKLFWAAKLLFGAFESYYWNQEQVCNAQKILSGKRFDIIIANDLSSAPLALKIAGGGAVLIDAHEYSPKEFDDKWLWRLLFGRYNHVLCQRYLPQASAMTTVCHGIAQEYARVYGVHPVVVHNAPMDQKLSPSSVSEELIRLIHHGSGIRSRHIGVMIEMMKFLDKRFTLDFMLMETDVEYMRELRQAAKSDSRISFIDPVPMPDICQKLNQYDIGVYLLPPVNFNHEHALPNKFFEFVQARLGVAIGPSPEMATLLRTYGCGVIAESFTPEALASSLQGLDAAQISAFKDASDRAAAELSYEHDGKVLLSEVARLL